MQLTTPIRPTARLASWLDRAREPSLSALVVIQIITMFIVGPLEDAGLLQLRAVELFILPMTLVSVFIAKRGGIGRLLILVAFGINVVVYALRAFLLTENLLPIAGAAASLLFIVTVSTIIARTVFADGRVTVHRIQGAVAIYLNIALAFGVVDNLIARLLPGAYANLPPSPRQLGVMIYFSLSTITTASYGDIAPVHPFARAMANLEAVMGQLYIAILVATLVGLHVSHRNRRDGR